MKPCTVVPDQVLKTWIGQVARMDEIRRSMENILERGQQIYECQPSWEDIAIDLWASMNDAQKEHFKKNHEVGDMLP